MDNFVKMKRIIKNNMCFEYHFFVPKDDNNAHNVIEVFDGPYDYMLDGCNLSILDIGANIGTFALWALRRFPNSTIVCYEPILETFEILKKNTEFFGIKSYQLAVSTEKNLVFRVNMNALDSAGKDCLTSECGEVMEVKVETVHPKEVGNFDIVKVNTEGAEVDILTNMNLDKTYIVMVESHSDEKRCAVQKHLYSQGFFLRQSRFMINRGAECYQRLDLPQDKFRNLFLTEKEMWESSKR